MARSLGTYLRGRFRREDRLPLALISGGVLVWAVLNILIWSMLNLYAEMLLGWLLDRLTPLGVVVLEAALAIISLMLTCTGFGLYAVNRGRSALWSLMGLCSCCGLPLLLVLTDLSEPSLAPGSGANELPPPIPPENDNPYQSY